MTYEYMCKSCGHNWEQEQKISEEPIKTCPECKKDEAERLISRGNGFILVGGGWASSNYS